MNHEEAGDYTLIMVQCISLAQILAVQTRQVSGGQKPERQYLSEETSNE